MAQELQHGHPVIRRIYLYIFILTFLLLFGFIVLYFALVQPSSQPEQTNLSLSPTALQTENKGTLTMAVQNNQLAEVSMGQTFNLLVSASAEDSKIVGYDVLLNYDKKAFSVGKATTPLQSFQVFSSDHNSYMTFTGALNVSGAPVVLSQTPILTVPFTAKQKGKYTFSILPKAQNELTKLVEAQTTRLFAPQVATLQVTVN